MLYTIFSVPTKGLQETLWYAATLWYEAGWWLGSFCLIRGQEAVLQTIAIVSPLREGGKDLFTLPKTGGVYVVEELVVSILSWISIALFDVGLMPNVGKHNGEEVPDAEENGRGEKDIFFCASAETLSEVLFVAHCRASKASRAFCPVVLKPIVAGVQLRLLSAQVSNY
jgi:hypothetical protein